MYKTFEKLAKNFDLNDYWINHKYEHSLNVAALALAFAKKINLNEEDTNLIEQIGLLHDIGRFKQLKLYQTFNDHKSIDHGDAGAKYLFEEGHIDEYNIPVENYETIKIAIKNHNKPNIDEKAEGRTLFFSKLIRDIDKIQILKENALGLMPISNCEEGINPIIDTDFKKHKAINISDIKNYNDEVVVTLGFIFDINFDISYKYIKENDIINKLEKFYDSEIFKEYFVIVNKFINDKTKE